LELKDERVLLYQLVEENQQQIFRIFESELR